MRFSEATKGKIARVAEFHGHDKTFALAAEEFSRAANMILQYRRASVDEDGDLMGARTELVDALAAQAVAIEMLCSRIPDLRGAVSRRADVKVNGALRRYKVPEKFPR